MSTQSIMMMKNEMLNENTMPSVSIIMAAYNAEKTILEAITSVQKQTFPDWELLVVNDCSTDSTAKIVSGISGSDSRIHIINNTVNSGVSLTRKRGLDEARGEWIAILDSDDIWMPNKLEKQIKLANQTGGELIFTGSAFMDEGGTPLDWVLHVPETIEYNRLLMQNIVSNSSVLVKTDLYRSHYATGDGMHEDFAIWLKITRDGHTAYGIDEPLLVYRLSSSSKSGNKLKAAKMNWKTYRYVGLNAIESSYYMCWYFMRGIQKYRHLWKH